MCYQWPRLNFGDKPAPDIASNAINIQAKVSQAEFPEAAKQLRERTYVDDIGGSRPTTVEAKHVTSSIDGYLEIDSFRLRLGIRTSRKSTKLMMNDLQICLVTGGKSKKTYFL